jgi:hypothetical protein
MSIHQTEREAWSQRLAVSGTAFAVITYFAQNFQGSETAHLPFGVLLQFWSQALAAVVLSIVSSQVRGGAINSLAATVLFAAVVMNIVLMIRLRVNFNQIPVAKQTPFDVSDWDWVVWVVLLLDSLYMLICHFQVYKAANAAAPGEAGQPPEYHLGDA